MEQIITHLKNSNHILLTTHISPDGDAIGSLIAMGLSLEALNKKITLYTEDPIPAVYRFLPSSDRIEHRIDTLGIYDTAIILDCADFQRIGGAFSAISRIPFMINIDHHITNTRFGDLQFINDSACATVEIIYRLIKTLKVPLNEAVAFSIYTGILTDTGSFRFSNTNRAAFAICEEMVGIGADPYKIAQHVYGDYSLGRIKLLNRVLDSIEISKNGKLSMMTLTQDMLNETGMHSEDIHGLIDYAKQIKHVEIAALIEEKSNDNGTGASEHIKQFNVGLRSNGTVNVAAIAATFGGGGHLSAAGFNIQSTLADIKAQIINLAENI